MDIEHTKKLFYLPKSKSHGRYFHDATARRINKPYLAQAHSKYNKSNLKKHSSVFEIHNQKKMYLGVYKPI